MPRGFARLTNRAQYKKPGSCPIVKSRRSRWNAPSEMTSNEVLESVFAFRFYWTRGPGTTSRHLSRFAHRRLLAAPCGVVKYRLPGKNHHTGRSGKYKENSCLAFAEEPSLGHHGIRKALRTLRLKLHWLAHPPIVARFEGGGNKGRTASNVSGGTDSEEAQTLRRLTYRNERGKVDTESTGIGVTIGTHAPPCRTLPPANRCHS